LLFHVQLLGFVPAKTVGSGAIRYDVQGSRMVQNAEWFRTQDGSAG
jgi:hypothetical protein